MLERYARQIILPEIAKEGQEKLQNTKVLCVGAGGLGSSALLYLAAAGIGVIGICDGDIVSRHNLQRQVLYDECHIGQNKSLVAKERLERLNSEVQVQAITHYLTAENALRLLPSYDYIIDACDNMTTKLILNDACHYLKKPLISASVLRFEGQLSVYWYPKGPCLRCLYSACEKLKGPNCAQAGVLGMVPGWFGLLQAFEVIKLRLNLSPPLIGQLWCFDFFRAMPRIYQFQTNPLCPLCTARHSFATLWPISCAQEAKMDHQISPVELFQRLAQKENIFLLDVRNPDEHAVFNIGGTLIPLAELPQRLGELPMHQSIVLYCRSGYRSQVALELLQAAGFKDLANLTGGVLAWQQSQGGFDLAE